MMQAAESWHRDDFGSDRRILCPFSAGRSLLAQAEMRPVLLIVPNVFAQQAFQMPFIQNDHAIEQIAVAGAHPTLSHAVLPGATKAGSLWLDAEALDGIDDLFIEVAATAKDQVTRRSVVSESLAQLLNNPGARWISGDIEVKNPSPVMRDDEEAIEDAKGQRRYVKEVHRGDGFSMIV